MRKQLGKRVSLSDKVSAPVALGDCFVCPAWLAQKNKGYNLATSPFSDLMRSQFDVNVSAFPRQWPLMTLKCSFSICPSRSLCVFQLGWSTRRSTTCCLAHARARTHNNSPFGVKSKMHQPKCPVQQFFLSQQQLTQPASVTAACSRFRALHFRWIYS